MLSVCLSGVNRPASKSQFLVLKWLSTAYRVLISLFYRLVMLKVQQSVTIVVIELTLLNFGNATYR